MKASMLAGAAAAKRGAPAPMLAASHCS